LRIGSVRRVAGIGHSVRLFGRRPCSYDYSVHSGLMSCGCWVIELHSMTS
jgi:hypothetical protein